MTRSRKLTIGGVVLGVGRRATYISTLNGASTSIDPARLATVEQGTMTRSVVATGKIEPITKVEIKSKANGIIERLAVDVDHRVEPGQVLAELDKENLTARLREARANLEAARAALTAAEAQARKNEIEAEAPELAFAKSAYDRATSLAEQKLISQEALDQARTNHEQALNRQRAAQSQLLVSRGQDRGSAGPGGAGAGRVGARRRGAGQLDDPGANPRHRAHPRRRDWAARCRRS